MAGKPDFVQIGDQIINRNAITYVDLDGPMVIVHFLGSDSVQIDAGPHSNVEKIINTICGDF